MNGKLFQVEIRYGQYNGSSEPDVRTMVICAHGVHVKYSIETLFSNNNELLYAKMGKIECATCDSSCRKRLDMRSGQNDPKMIWREHVEFLRSRKVPFQADPMERVVSHSIYSDGDSGSTEYCHGTYHVVMSCSEFGSDWCHQQVKACDCHRRSDVVLPEAVAKRVKNFLSKRTKLQNGKMSYPTPTTSSLNWSTQPLSLKRLLETFTGLLRFFWECQRRTLYRLNCPSLNMAVVILWGSSRALKG